MNIILIKGGTDLKRGGYSENSRETIRDDSVHLCAVWQLWNIMVLNPRVRKAVIV